MKWITRERVKVDRVACPWLIRKFVDPQAEFLFVPADKVMESAVNEGAIPYDVPNVELGHHGKECSFDAILKKYNLTTDQALVLLARSLPMKQFLLSLVLTTLSIAFAAQVQAEERTVIEILRGTKAQAAVGDVIRVAGRIPSGQGAVSVDVKGPGKLVSTSALRQMSNGRPLIGSCVKEFDIQAEERGTITITVTIDNRVQRREQKTEYTVEVK